jgi:hypothetical protein
MNLEMQREVNKDILEEGVIMQASTSHEEQGA